MATSLQCMMALLALAVAFFCHSAAAPLPTPTGPLLAFTSLPYGFTVSNLTLEVISCAVPRWLHGSLFRNGPGRFPNISDVHWFDGLALVQAFHFNEGDVTYDASFVGSLEYNFSAPSDL